MKSCDLCFSNFTDIKNLIHMSDYVTFILDRPLGFGFSDFIESAPKKVPRSIKYLTG